VIWKVSEHVDQSNEGFGVIWRNNVSAKTILKKHKKLLNLRIC